MDPDVALGVPLGILGRVDQGDQLGRDRGQHPPLAEEPQPDRRAPRLEQQLLDLAEDPFRRQLAQWHRRAPARRLRIDGQLEARRELDRAQRAQRVFAERLRVDRAQDPPLEVALAAEGIGERAREGVEHQRVDREIPAAGRLLEAQVRIAGHRDAAVSRARLGIAPREGHVHCPLRPLETADLQDREGLADRVHAPGSGEHFLEMREGEAEDLDVDILVGQAEERVAHGAAHEVGPSPGVPERLQETTHSGRDLGAHARNRSTRAQWARRAMVVEGRHTWRTDRNPQAGRETYTTILVSTWKRRPSSSPTAVAAEALRACRAQSPPAFDRQRDPGRRPGLLAGDRTTASAARVRRRRDAGGRHAVRHKPGGRHRPRDGRARKDSELRTSSEIMARRDQARGYLDEGPDPETRRR